MSDIVEMLRQGTEDGNLTPVGELCVSAADEIESLRQQLGDVFDEKKILSQRVKELEESLSIAINTGMDQITTLKQAQSEPVAWLRKETRIVLALPLVAVTARPAVCGEITLLTNTHFVPAFETELRKQVEAWAKQKGVPTRVDFVASAEFNAKMVCEAETKAGHDIVVIKQQQPALFKDSLVDLDALAKELGSQHGGWLPIAEQAFVDGHWKAIPFYHQSFPAVYRKDLFQEIGVTRQQVHKMNWDQFLEAAKKLHAKGKPVAFAISQTDDADNNLYALLWAFGGSTVRQTHRIPEPVPSCAPASRRDPKQNSPR